MPYKTDKVLLAAIPGATVWGLRNATEIVDEKRRLAELDKLRNGWIAVEPLTRFKIGTYSEVGQPV